ncbi:hypothetical protein ES288_A07G150600v1 [Gossypium darwinii]|uniref:Uncharacterized protein n=1 Tax=Gossypium darwinii TaxID=34276 RepID=A0A5D2FZ85_GOSDA|nr:hypothetical protein ES288_A07G150600v1 [Gossypium darwinii]
MNLREEREIGKRVSWPSLMSSLKQAYSVICSDQSTIPNWKVVGYYYAVLCSEREGGGCIKNKK